MTKRSIHSIAVAALGAACACLVAAPVRAGTEAGPTDHMKCYKVKDPAPKAAYTANLDGPLGELGCKIKVPAKLLCNFVEKQGITPTAPSPFVSGQTFGGQLFVCYKVKCGKVQVDEFIGDQFGARAATLKSANLLCSPANVPNPA